MKKRNIVISEIIIIVVLILAFLLPRIIGEEQVETVNGYINVINDLNGHVIGVTNKREESEFIAERLDDYEQIEYQDFNEGVKALKDLKIDALVCDYEDARFAIDNNDELAIYEIPFIRLAVSNAEMKDLYYIVVRKVDCGFHTTSKSLEALMEPGIKVACLTGVEDGMRLQEINPDCIIEYYDNYIDLFTSLSNNKVDYTFGYDDNALEIMPSFSNLAVIPEPHRIVKECFALSKTEKGNKLTEQFGSFLGDIQESGKFYEIIDKWKNGKGKELELEKTNFTGENGTLSVCTPGSWHPYTFINNNEITGIFIEIVNNFCEEYGYIPEYTIATFTSELAGLSSGEYDLMADLCENTPERSESVNLTKPVLSCFGMIFTKADSAPLTTVSKASSFFDSLKNKFYKNFIEQNRYKMIFEGLWTTIRISILATIFGTLLGILICFMRMSNKTLLNAFARIYIKTIQGTPIVVLLLILYYIIFTNSSVTGFWTSVLGFTIDFSAYVSEIFRTAIESVPEGQAIAAKALGFSKVQAFIKVVLPQALISIIPVYSGQFISLIKSTSVVGYIAVQDLTKMSDLIRGSTYEAFFPLISTAIIYFVISTLLIQLLNIIANKVDPLKRDRTVKGVKTDAI